MSVQRWDFKSGINGQTWQDKEGRYVLHADHVAALAEAEQQFNETLNRLGKCNGCQEDLDYVRAEALREAREAVAALPKGGMGLRAHELWRNALAAIDALGGQSND
jgi:hypothetical protein